MFGMKLCVISKLVTVVQFLQRQRVLGIYRDMLKTIRQVPDEGDRKYLTDWARDEFKRNKNATNQVNQWSRACSGGTSVLHFFFFFF